MIKNCKYFTLAQLIKFNRTQIKLDLDGIVLTKKSHVSDIFFIINHNKDFTNLKEIINTKLSSKNSMWPKKQEIPI